MTEMINISFVDGKEMQIGQGATLAYLASISPESTLEPLAAVVNDELQELDYPLFADSKIRWLDYDCDLGRAIYKRGSIFVLNVAAKQLFPKRQLWVSHSLGDGLFCWLDREDGIAITPTEVTALGKRYMELVEADLPIRHTRISREDGATYFRMGGNTAKAHLLEHRSDAYVSLYTMEGVCEYLFGRMVNRSGLLGKSRLQPFEDGFVLHLPPRHYLDCLDTEQFEPKQLHTILNEYHDWSELLKVETVADLNDAIAHGEFRELMLIAETLQERALHKISDDLFSLFPEVRLLLLAGPSSSGKTTTTQRLKIQLRTLGIKPILISMDDYFIDREKTPLQQNGKPDYEGLSALNLSLFNQHMQALLAGEEVRLCRYDFVSGKSGFANKSYRLEDNQIILVEGIHALNEQVSQTIDARNKRKMFVSALTQLNFDQYTPVGTSDVRLFRRMVRDMQFRNMTPSATLNHWDEVRRGEHQNIFPFQE
ncbi:MAG: hypothetical protein RR387_04540, partial [Clostridiales bacterium]